ncbi:DUF6541 family protein [Corynebacterium sp.]|uniref:DUF6541 family protein n=1 Tax=Corynebacterium sp. TaxID=1720 RepID=UPI002A91F067|nr:DUF6541 family protein [Corynebacterium sp.]MDY5786427.1 DUF6541 family protein [Corynebacterium sp.]
MALAGVVLIALLVFVLPGFVVSWVAGAKSPAALAAALPVTFGIVGLSSWLWGEAGARFGWLTFSVSLIFTVAAAAVWRWAFARRVMRRGDVSWRRALWPGDDRAGSIADPYWIIPAAGAVAGAWMIISDRLSWLVRLPHGVGNIVQGWDSQWHANLVRYIMDEGVASATRMGELQNMESRADLLYPSGFHAATALFAQAAGIEPIPAVNIASTVVPGVALPISMACLCFTVLRSRGLTAQIAAALAAIAIYVAPPLLWISDYVGMWPYLAATCMVGSVIWLLCRVPGHRALAFPAALAFVGVLSTHPSAVTYVALPVALYWLTSLMIRPERSRLTDTLWLAVPALAGTVLFLPQALAGTEQAEEVSGWATPEDARITDPWNAVVTMDTRHVSEFFPVLPEHSATTLLWLAGFGALVALLWRGQIWAVLFYAFSAAAAVNAMSPFDGWWGETLAIVGNLHYNTAHRLVLPVAILTVAGAAIGVAAMVRLVCLAPVAARRGSASWIRASVIASVVVAVVTASATAGWVRERASDGARAAYSAARVGDRMVDDDDLRAFDWLATQSAAWEGYTMGDPADGHSWMYAYNGVPTISRHYMWPVGGRGSNTDVLYWGTDMLGSGVRATRAGDTSAMTTENLVDRAAKDLNVKFFIASPEPFWWIQYPNYGQIKGLWTSPGVTPVYRQGETVIFALNEQFTDAELRAMRADGLAHGSDDLPELEPVGTSSGVTAAAQ